MRSYTLKAGATGVVVMFVVGLSILSLTRNPLLAIGAGTVAGFITGIAILVLE